MMEEKLESLNMGNYLLRDGLMIMSSRGGAFIFFKAGHLLTLELSSSPGSPFSWCPPPEPLRKHRLPHTTPNHPPTPRPAFSETVKNEGL